MRDKRSKHRQLVIHLRSPRAFYRTGSQRAAARAIPEPTRFVLETLERRLDGNPCEGRPRNKKEMSAVQERLLALAQEEGEEGDLGGRVTAEQGSGPISGSFFIVVPHLPTLYEPAVRFSGSMELREDSQISILTESGVSEEWASFPFQFAAHEPIVSA